MRPPSLRQSLSDLGRVARLFRAEWPAVGRAGALSVVSGALGLAAPLLTAIVFDRVYPAGNTSLLALVVLGLVAAQAAEGATRSLYRFAAFAARTRMRDVARLALFNHVLHLPSRVLERRRSGEISARFADVRSVLDTGADAALTAMSQGVYLVAVPPILFLIEPRLALLAVLVVPVTATVTALLGAVANRRWAETYDAYDAWAAFRVEAIREARTFKAMGCEAALYRRAQRHVARAHQGTVAATGLWYLCTGTNAVVRAVHLAALTYVGWRLVLAGDLTLGGYVAFQAYAALLLAPLAALIEAGGKLQKAGVSLGRVFDLADEPPEADPAATMARAEGHEHRDREPVSRERGEDSDLETRWTGRIRARSIHFLYDRSDRTNRTDRATLDRSILDLPLFDLAPGEIVAVTGPSGCGKTTLLRLLAGVERPHAGRIEAEVEVETVGTSEVHWRPIEDVPGWRDRLAVCWQEPGLLSSSIRDNLLVACEDLAATEQPVADQDLRAALDACALGDRLGELATGPEGARDPLAVRLTEGAAALSAGERQRVALARLLLRVRVAARAGAPVRLVLLDEATANLDAATARAVLACLLDELRRAPSPPAVVLVTHQTEHAALADRQLVLSARPSIGDEVTGDGATGDGVSGDGQARPLPTLSPTPPQ